MAEFINVSILAPSSSYKTANSSEAKIAIVLFEQQEQMVRLEPLPKLFAKSKKHIENKSHLKYNFDLTCCFGINKAASRSDIV